MDYSALKKLAISMGEEFKVIDNVTLEAINVQRLITRENEYCATLEALIKSSQEEISTLENETSNTKSKLDDVNNVGSLLESSLDSLNSSHAMVEMLKRDLLKQFQLEEIRTSDQNIKFESTMKKYEDMWEHYKVVYKKFPLVSDLNAVQLKLKLERIQLSLLEKESKDIERKISELISIQDRKGKSLIIKVAEMYTIRERRKRERDELEKSIKLKRSSIESEKLLGPQLLSYRPSSKSEEDKQLSDSLSVLMDNFIMELAKEKTIEQVPFIDKEKSYDKQHGSHHDYDGACNRGNSGEHLKLIPLPVFDSPPRKIRSVGNLLSPLKDWTREHDYEAEVKSLHSTESVSNNFAISGGSDDVNELKTKELSISTNMDVDLPDLECPESHSHPKTTASKSKMEPLEAEMPMETDELEENGNVRSSSFKHEEESQKEIEAIIEPQPGNEENVDEVQVSMNKPDIISDSPDFTYEPRIIKPAKVEQEPVTTSPYFDESSYLNFMDVPKETVKSVNKERMQKERDKKLIKDAKEEISVIDLDSDVVEQNKNQCGEPGLQKTDPNIGKEYSMTHHGDIKSASFTHGEQDMERSSQVVSHMGDSSHGKNTNNRQLPACNDDDIKVKKSDCNPIYQEHKPFENVSDVPSPQPLQTNEDLNISYGSPMNYSQMSYADSIDYQDAYQTFSPEASAIDESPQFIPGDSGPANIFGSCSEKTGFNYGFPQSSQQSSAASLFGDATSGNNASKERKQNEVFNFSFDTKSKTPTMFKLF